MMPSSRSEFHAKMLVVLRAPATLQLADGYVQVAARGPVAVKGVAEPVEIHVLTGASAQRTRLLLLRGRRCRDRHPGRDISDSRQ